jgi:RHS repeat-associated protein
MPIGYSLYTFYRYTTFGSPIPNRSFSASRYKYGFNGKEKDDEVNVNGGDYDYGERMYDSRLARFLSLDPLQKKFAELTPYQFASNTPIMASDLDGLEANVEVAWDGKTKPTITLVVYIQIDNQSTYSQDKVSNITIETVKQMEESYKGTVTINGVEFNVKADVYINEDKKQFSLTYKDLGTDYKPEQGVLGEADEIGNTQVNNSDVYLGTNQDDPTEVAITTTHEKGHELGLVHTGKKKNLMNPKDDGTGTQTKVTSKQLKDVVKLTLGQQKDQNVKKQIKTIAKTIKLQQKEQKKLDKATKSNNKP